MNIFNPNFPTTFKLFTPSHIITMILIGALWIVVPIVFKRTKSNKLNRIFRYTLAILLLAQYIGWMVWEAAVGRFTVQLSLPFNLCDISVFLCAVLLFTESYALYEILYFWALAGTIQSYITPNLYFGFPHLEFIVFYIQHGGEILTILFFTFVTGFRPRFVSLLKSLGVLAGYLSFVYIFNMVSGSNYMFLMADTPHPSTVTKMIKLFGAPPRHLIGLGLVAVVSLLVLYIPFAIKDMFSRTRNKNHQ